MLTEKTLIRIGAASALYDLIVTAPFMTPWSYRLLVDTLNALHDGLALPGLPIAPDRTQMLLANLLGSVVVVWSLARLHLRLPILARYDAVARILFATWQAYALAMGASALIAVFLAAEIGFGIAQSLPLTMLRRTARPA